MMYDIRSDMTLPPGADAPPNPICKDCGAQLWYRGVWMDGKYIWCQLGPEGCSCYSEPSSSVEYNCLHGTRNPKTPKRIQLLGTRTCRLPVSTIGARSLSTFK